MTKAILIRKKGAPLGLNTGNSASIAHYSNVWNLIIKCVAFWISKAINGSERAPKANLTNLQTLSSIGICSSSLNFILSILSAPIQHLVTSHSWKCPSSIIIVGLIKWSELLDPKCSHSKDGTKSVLYALWLLSKSKWATVQPTQDYVYVTDFYNGVVSSTLSLISSVTSLSLSLLVHKIRTKTAA